MSKFFDNPLLLIVLVVLIILVFGANKLPGAARSLGRSMRIFKSEVKQMNDDDTPVRDDDAGRPLEGKVVNGPGSADGTAGTSRSSRPVDADDEAHRRGA